MERQNDLKETANALRESVRSLPAGDSADDAAVPLLQHRWEATGMLVKTGPASATNTGDEVRAYTLASRHNETIDALVQEITRLRAQVERAHAALDAADIVLGHHIESTLPASVWQEWRRLHRTALCDEATLASSSSETTAVQHLKSGDGTLCGATQERGNSFYEWAYVTCRDCLAKRASPASFSPHDHTEAEEHRHG